MEYNIYAGFDNILEYQYTEDYDTEECAIEDAKLCACMDYDAFLGDSVLDKLSNSELTEEEVETMYVHLKEKSIKFKATLTELDVIPNNQLVGSKYMD